MFRAYDKRDGKVVWEAKMPTLVTGAPMTYEINGRQYIVLAVSKRGEPAELVALTLDGASENGVAPAGGVPLGCGPASIKAAAQAVSATPEELALGKAKFDVTCAACHGPNGAGLQGSSAPPLTEPDGLRQHQPRHHGRTGRDAVTGGYAAAGRDRGNLQVCRQIARTQAPPAGGRPPVED